MSDDERGGLTPMLDRFVPEYGSPTDPEVRARYGNLEVAVSIVGNLAFFVLKLVLGLLIASVALLADAFHTLSDVGTSFVVYLGFKAAKKPPDAEHPFGHGRAEHVAAFAVGLLLVIAGLEFMVESGRLFFEGPGIAAGDYLLPVVLIVVLSGVGKELMARFSAALGRKISSTVLEADAWHHRSDALTSFGVAIAIVGTAMGYPVLDPVFGVIVSLLIAYTGIDLARRSSDYLVGKAPEGRDITEIERTVRGIEGVKGAHKVYVHDYGGKKVVSLHVDVEPGLTASDAHTIADEAERAVAESTDADVTVHVDLEEDSEPREEIIKTLGQILDHSADVVSYHGIDISDRPGGKSVSMHIIVDQDMSVAASHGLSHDITEALKSRFGNVEVQAHIEPCSRECGECREACEKREAA